jgi:CheY-like chemotaxis protein
MGSSYRRVLVADDIVPVQRTLARLARAALDAEEVETASDGSEVLKLLIAARDRGAPFDLLLSDIGMPHWSGARLLMRMREAELDVPTLFCTGRTDCPAIAQLRGLGFIVLDKPFAHPVVQQALASRPKSPMAIDADELAAATCTSPRAPSSACSVYCGAHHAHSSEDLQRLSLIREGQRRLDRVRQQLPSTPVTDLA